jgi:hypothetical protein
MFTLVDASQDTGVRVRIRSPHSKETRAAASAFRAAAAKGPSENPAENVKTEVERLSQFSLEQIVAATIGWTGLVSEGKPVLCTPENVRALYTDERTQWIRDQVEVAFWDPGRFLPARDQAVAPKRRRARKVL